MSPSVELKAHTSTSPYPKAFYPNPNNKYHFLTNQSPPTAALRPVSPAQSLFQKERSCSFPSDRSRPTLFDAFASTLLPQLARTLPTAIQSPATPPPPEPIAVPAPTSGHTSSPPFLKTISSLRGAPLNRAESAPNPISITSDQAHGQKPKMLSALNSKAFSPIVSPSPSPPPPRLHHRVSDQNTQWSTSDRSVSHTPSVPFTEAPSHLRIQVTKRSSRLGASSHTDARLLSPIWEPLAIPIQHIDEPVEGWSQCQAFIREGLNARLDVHVRDVRIIDPSICHEAGSERSSTPAPLNTATPAKSDAQVQAHTLPDPRSEHQCEGEGGLLAHVRIWSECDGEMEAAIRREVFRLAAEFAILHD